MDTANFKFLVHQAVFSTGERLPLILHRETLAPVTLPNWYLLSRRRDTKSASTLLRDASVLRWLFEWAAERELDLTEKLRSDVFTADEITALSRYLRVGRNSKILGAVYGTEGGTSPETLSNNTLSNYLGVIKDFLEWAIVTFTPRKIHEGSVRIHLMEAQDRLTRAFGALPGPKQFRRGQGLTEEEVQELLEVVRPESSRNPFRPAYRQRNQLIIQCFIFLGLRRGELLKLRLDDLPLGIEQTITIVKSSEDPDDPRRREPGQKTLERELYCSRWLALELHSYAARRKGKTKYLFTNNRGKPLDYGGIHLIFKTLGKILPELRDSRRLHPHALRHTCAENFRHWGNKAGFGDFEIQEAMRNQFGWSIKSSMPSHYTQREINQLRRAILQAYQQRFEQ